MPARRSYGIRDKQKGAPKNEKHGRLRSEPDLTTVMKKIKVIKRNEVEVKLPPTNRKATARPKKPRSVESTIQDWISERRENNDAEHRSRNSQFAAWTTDSIPAEAV